MVNYIFLEACKLKDCFMKILTLFKHCAAHNYFLKVFLAGRSMKVGRPALVWSGYPDSTFSFKVMQSET